jgi:hypothetical protein
VCVVVVRSVSSPGLSTSLVVLGHGETHHHARATRPVSLPHTLLASYPGSSITQPGCEPVCAYTMCDPARVLLVIGLTLTWMQRLQGCPDVSAAHRRQRGSSFFGWARLGIDAVSLQLVVSEGSRVVTQLRPHCPVFVSRQVPCLCWRRRCVHIVRARAAIRSSSNVHTPMMGR